ncbi:Membrane protein involved in the export of O-antigen and teichoic acid [Micromonospora rhizosphaerae]|uniref:Membrane protein involved in the export of O-antigen and teichoic acid n=1 Tax=Micromonospora rhizosphaerae TaxID=568872 RepID=A0A1C6S3D3_9ACTN|nr:oligosaccharide flippase family protein [Micromonospora rhizosphaerae]SCL23995.1 Membrane protein involved in the export of O-antigen and teichoic acid [Micromonospora rhizosphaerae]
MVAIVAGSAGGQLLALAAAPLLSRIYGPADFGVLAVVAALATTIGTVAAFRFDLAIPLPERERDAQALVALGLAATGVTAVGGTVGVLAVGDEIARLFGQPELELWLWVVSPAAAAMGVVLVLNQLAIRHRRYGSIGRRNFFQSLVSVVTQLTAGVTGLRPGGMVLGFGVGPVAAALVLLRDAGLRGAEARAGRDRRHLRDMARRYCRFPFLLAPSGLLNILGTQLPVLLIAYWYGSSVAGWLGLTQRVIAMPAALVATAVAQVYLAEISRAAREHPRHSRLIFVLASRKLTLFAGFSALALAVAAPPLFSVIFGPEWAISGVYAQALAVYTGVQLVASPLSQTLVVFERQGLQLAWDVGRVLVVAGTVSAVAMAGASPLVAVWSLSISGSLAYAASWLMSLQAVTAGSRQAEQVEDTDERQLSPRS